MVIGMQQRARLGVHRSAEKPHALRAVVGFSCRLALPGAPLHSRCAASAPAHVSTGAPGQPLVVLSEQSRATLTRDDDMVLDRLCPQSEVRVASTLAAGGSHT